LATAKQGPLVRSLFDSHGFTEQAFSTEEQAKNDDLVGTCKPNTGKGYSPICPISVLGTCSFSGEYQPSLDIPVQLSLPFNVRRIDHNLYLAPRGRWSDLDYILNKDHLIDSFLSDFKRWSKLKRFAKKTYFDTFNMVLANLEVAHRTSSQLLLSRTNGKHRSSDPISIDNRRISLVTDYLADRGLIDLYIGRRSDEDKNTSWCIPLMPLIAILDKHDAEVRLHQKTQFAVVRDSDKNPIPVYTNKSKALRLHRLAKPVREHYETWLNHTATLDGSYLLPWLRRLFNRNMDLGGRFYGHYQNIPSVDRKRIRIDGEPTVELDYKSLHIAVLYALEGSRPGRDPYVIEGHEDKRPAIKSIFLSLVNTENLSSLKANITRSGNPEVQKEFRRYKSKREQYERLRALNLKAVEPVKPVSIKKGFIENIPEGANGGDYLKLIIDRHRKIEHHFGTENIGLRLQNIDSELMALALDKLGAIPCLPVHDSIRCKVSDSSLVNQAMVDSFNERFGQNIIVTSDQ
jgi:hypothetical protein